MGICPTPNSISLNPRQIKIILSLLLLTLNKMFSLLNADIFTFAPRSLTFQPQADSNYSLYLFLKFLLTSGPLLQVFKLNQMLKSYILQKYNNPSNIGIYISFFHNCISQGNCLHIHKCFHFLTSQSLPHCYQSDV